MNYFERMIQTYQRRIKSITENPDPRRLRTNKLLFEIQCEHMMAELEAWKNGEPFIYSEGIDSRFQMAMGFHVIPLTPYADRTGGEADRYFQIARSAGFPDYGCDRYQVALGMALSGDLPPPSLVVGIAGLCDQGTFQSHYLAQHFDCPDYVVDIHPEHSYESLRYMASQHEELIELAEATVPGIKYNEQKLIEFQEADKINYGILREIFNLRKAVPCPLQGRDVLRMPRIQEGTTERQSQYLRAFHDEVMERVEKGKGLANEKLRFMWLISGPFFYDVFSFMERRGVSVPYYEFGIAAASYLEGGWGMPGNDAEYGRKLTPIEEACRRMNGNTWGGLHTERRVRDAFKMTKELHIDALVHFMLSGCPVNLGSAQILAEAAEREFGIPSLMIEGWCLDREKFNQPEFERTLDAFIGMCLERKGISPS